MRNLTPYLTRFSSDAHQARDVRKAPVSTLRYKLTEAIDSLDTGVASLGSGRIHRPVQISAALRASSREVRVTMTAEIHLCSPLRWCLKKARSSPD